MIKPEPTKRGVIDLGRKCNIDCKFCYHRFVEDKDRKWFVSPDGISAILSETKNRGNTWVDFTGGEPTLYPEIWETIRQAHRIGLKVCIITNGIVSHGTLEELIRAGTDEFLVSRHGPATMHNKLTGCKGADREQDIFLQNIKDERISFRYNCVMNKINQNEIYLTAATMTIKQPKIINLINMNPHYDWKNRPDASELLPDLEVLSKQLNALFDSSYNDGSIGFNVRYFPLCLLNEKHRKYVCNDLHVMFDPYEWDSYFPGEKTYDNARQKSIQLSVDVENKSEPCKDCNLQWVCGGINKEFYRIKKPLLNPITSKVCDTNDFYFYRRENRLALFCP